MNNADYIQVPQGEAPVTFYGPAFTPQWIPVHVALPEDRQEVFFVRLGRVYRGQWRIDEAPCFQSERGMRYWHPREGVTHWMPSPTPEPPVASELIPPECRDAKNARGTY